MDIRQIRHLIAVLEHGNVLRAAHAIHISQPALSKSIQNLEAELGVRLLERGPRGVSPTIYGTTLLKHARLLLNQGAQAVAEIGAIKDGHLGHLRLGVANFAIHFLPAVLGKLLSSKPGLSFDIVDGTYEGLAAGASGGRSRPRGAGCHGIRARLPARLSAVSATGGADGGAQPGALDPPEPAAGHY
jgi:DNA-binding transcriptional LysR family regulator